MTGNELALGGEPSQEIDRPEGIGRENGAVLNIAPLVCQYVGSLRQRVTWVREFTARIRLYHFYGPVDFTETGFHGSGDENAIGLIVMPSVQTKDSSVLKFVRRLIEDPDATSVAWGHTAIYVRKNGKILVARGFGPHGDVLGSADAIIGGTGSIAGKIHDDFGMFNMVEARTIEFPLTEDQAEEAGQRILNFRMYARKLHYVTQPNLFVDKNTRFREHTNCLKWAIERMEEVMRAHLMSSVPDIRMLDLGPSQQELIGASSQGRLFQNVVYVSNNHPGALVLKSVTDNRTEINNRRVAGRFPQTLRILYAVRTLFLILGMAYFGGRHVYPNLALPNTRTHALVAGGFGMVAGIAHQRLIAEARQLYESIQQAEFVPFFRRAGLLGTMAVAFFAPGAAKGMLRWIAGGMGVYGITNLIAHAIEGLRGPPKIRQ